MHRAAARGHKGRIYGMLPNQVVKDHYGLLMACGAMSPMFIRNLYNQAKIRNMKKAPGRKVRPGAVFACIRAEGYWLTAARTGVRIDW